MPWRAASSLKSLFGGGRSSDGPSIEADAQGRRIMVRGSSDQVSQVRALLTQMGEDGNGSGGTYASGGLRTVPLGGRDARQILSLLEQVWPEADNRPIRIVVPSAMGAAVEGGRRDRIEESTDAPVRKTVTPAPVEETSGSKSPASSVSGTPRARAAEMLQPVDLRDAVAPSPKPTEPAPADTTAGGDADEESLEPDTETEKDVPASEKGEPPDGDKPLPPAKEPARDLELEEALRQVFGSPAEDRSPRSRRPASENESAPPAAKAGDKSPASAAQPGKAAEGGAAPIVVSSSGNNLLLSSDDDESLDRMEEMLNTLIQSSSQKTKWTVFYLRTADATETSQILGNLFPTGSVVRSSDSGSSLFGSFGSSLSSLGGSVADMTGLNSLAKTDERLRIIPETRSNALFVSVRRTRFARSRRCSRFSTPMNCPIRSATGCRE